MELSVVAGSPVGLILCFFLNTCKYNVVRNFSVQIKTTRLDGLFMAIIKCKFFF